MWHSEHLYSLARFVSASATPNRLPYIAFSPTPCGFIVFDGKGSELHHDASESGVHYYGTGQVTDFFLSLGR